MAQSLHRESFGSGLQTGPAVKKERAEKEEEKSDMAEQP